MSSPLAIHHSRGPVIRRETLQLFERVDVAGENRLVPFERELLWVRESEARLFMSHRQAHVKELGTFHDFYGYLTSVSGAIDEAQTYLDKYRIKPRDQLQLSIVLDVFDRPLLLDASRMGKQHNAQYDRKQYLKPPIGLWYTSDQAQPSKHNASYPRLETIEIIHWETVWSSAKGYFGQARVEALSDEVSHLLPRE